MKQKKREKTEKNLIKKVIAKVASTKHETHIHTVQQLFFCSVFQLFAIPVQITNIYCFCIHTLLHMSSSKQSTSNRAPTERENELKKKTI